MGASCTPPNSYAAAGQAPVRLRIAREAGEWHRARAIAKDTKASRAAGDPESEPEPTAFPGLRFDPHVAAVRGDDLVRDVEAEPDSFALGARDAEEFLEDPLAVLGRDPWSL